jgi:acyl-CoA hydrolase
MGNACYSTLVEVIYPQNANGDGTGFGGQLITWMSINSKSTIRLKFPNTKIYFKG